MGYHRCHVSSVVKVSDLKLPWNTVNEPLLIMSRMSRTEDLLGAFVLPDSRVLSIPSRKAIERRYRKPLVRLFLRSITCSYRSGSHTGRGRDELHKVWIICLWWECHWIDDVNHRYSWVKVFERNAESLRIPPLIAVGRTITTTSNMSRTKRGLASFYIARHVSLSIGVALAPSRKV